MIIEDELVLRKTIHENLKQKGFEVLEAGDGESGLEKALHQNPDLVLLDILLPKLNGFWVCEEIRKVNLSLPIVMLTAKDDEVDKVMGLRLGADDYITKPFSMAELIARIEALFRRIDVDHRSPTGLNEHHFGDVDIYYDRMEVFKNKNIIRLTKRELDVLKYLIQNKGKVVSRFELLENVWGYETMISTRTVDNHIARLRKELEDDTNNPKYILSYRSAGYKFVEPA